LINGVEIHYASHVEDVLAVALPLLKAKIDARAEKLPFSEEELTVNAAA